MTTLDQTRTGSGRYFGSSRIIRTLAQFPRIDRVLLLTAVILAVIALIVPRELPGIVAFAARALVEIAPFIVVSVALAAYLKASGADRLIGHAFRGRARETVLLAAVVGAFSPFCSCGVIPLVAALLASGVPLAPVMAFWLASPLMDPEMFILLSATLGVPFTVAKTAAAVAMGVFGGATVLALQRGGRLQDPLSGAVSTCGAGAVTSDARPLWLFHREPERRLAFWKETRNNGLFLGKWLGFAFLLEAMMLTWVPAETLGEWLADLGALSIPAAALLGVPAYLNGYAAIPTTDALMQLGLSQAAGLTFMVAGGVTSIPAAIAVKALVKTHVFALYLAVSLVGACAIGFVYAAFLMVP